MAHKRLHKSPSPLVVVVDDDDEARQEFENVVADNEAELRHLRLELHAIEVQSMSYVPKDADPYLEQSIRNWKEDWHALREKYAMRRGSSFVAAGGNDDSGSPGYSLLASSSPMSH